MELCVPAHGLAVARPEMPLATAHPDPILAAIKRVGFSFAASVRRGPPRAGFQTLL